MAALHFIFIVGQQSDALKIQTLNSIIQKQINKREQLFLHECFIKHVLLKKNDNFARHKSIYLNATKKSIFRLF
jgi:hypothetical protein